MQLAATQVGNRNCCPAGWQSPESQTPALAVRAEAPPCGGSQKSPRGLRHENICATGRPRRTKSRCLYLCRTKTVSRLRLACNAAHPKQLFSYINPPRHYAASGLLNLLTTLVQAIACTTPGVKLPGAKIKQKLFTRKIGQIGWRQKVVRNPSVRRDRA